MDEPTSIGPSTLDQRGLGPEPGRPPHLVPLMSRRDRRVFFCLVALWMIALALFWAWWLHPEHNIGTFRFLINTLLLFWTTVLPGYFFAMLARSRMPNPALRMPHGWRVAMVVTKAPSEPAAMIKQTLRAMLAQRYPHDTWLADEDPTPELLAWCDRHGIRVSTRRGVADYHRATWPRRTKCKEGNLAYFYDSFGYDHYDVVVQLDADHVPADGYLEAMLRPFLDPRVGYVSAPSMCDANVEASWAARGRLQVEAALHGPLQAGYNGGFAPLCIGSHYAVRSTALRDIGGLGPELAEDHSTTLLMNAKGWRGVHALDAEAHGDGPATFADMIVQEFQWCRSLVTILLRYTPQYMRSLSTGMKLQFLFSELWYVFYSVSMLAGIVLPVIALMTGRAWVGISYVEFFFRMAVLTIVPLVTIRWLHLRGWLRPSTTALSWEGLLFIFARWPWTFLGVIVAVVDLLRGKTSGFRVTPKGPRTAARLPFGVVLPYLAISTLSGATALLVGDPGSAMGFYLFAIFNALLYLAIAAVIVAQHHGAAGLGSAWPYLRPARRSLAFGTAAVVLVAATALRVPDGIAGILWGSGFAASTSASIRGDWTHKIQLGVYDRKKAFQDVSSVAVEHEFVSWLDDNAERLGRLAAYARQRNRWPMVTVEPWSDGRQGYTSLLRAVVSGDYDDAIRRACSELAGMSMPLFVRWGHEMEAPTGRYPWADDDADAYVAAYRKFVDTCRSENAELYFVWSPRGDMGGVESYYPGNDVVDYVGLSVFSYAAWEEDYYGRRRSFAENLWERYDRVRRYGKNVMIAELGIDGGLARRVAWLSDGFAVLDRFPLLKIVVYFNSADHPEAWGPDWPVPDWSIEPRVFVPETD